MTKTQEIGMFQRQKPFAAIVISTVTVVASAMWIGQRAMPIAAHAASAPEEVAVGPQYDTTHVYVPPEDFDRFVASLIATFGGKTTKEGVFTVTPTPSSTM
jgi:hypothetical protein